jgi:hypothetical protein
MDGTSLAIRFSYMPNALRYCGPKEANKDFLSYFSSGNKKIAAAVEADLKRFEGLYPYLSAIAAKANKRFTDYDVIEAYWLGNKILGKFGSKDMKAIINALVKRGLPAAIAKERIKHLPKGMFPHHNFNVCYIGVGQVTGAVKTTLENMNNCMINSGIVKEVKKNKLVVAKQLLEYDHGKLILGSSEKLSTVAYLPQMLPNVKVGDTVALHWNFAPAILAKRQAKNLGSYTKKLLGEITIQF